MSCAPGVVLAMTSGSSSISQTTATDPANACEPSTITPGPSPYNPPPTTREPAVSLHHRQHHVRRELRRAVHPLRRPPEVGVLGVIDVHEPPRVPVHHREPRALHLHHDPVPRAERVVHVVHREPERRRRARPERLGPRGAVPELPPHDVAPYQHLVSTHLLRA